MALLLFSDYAMDLNMSCTSEEIEPGHVSVTLHYNYLGPCWNPLVSFEGQSLVDSTSHREDNVEVSNEGTYYINVAVPYAEYVFTFKTNETQGNRTEQCSCITSETGK